MEEKANEKHERLYYKRVHTHTHTHKVIKEARIKNTNKASPCLLEPKPKDTGPAFLSVAKIKK